MTDDNGLVVRRSDWQEEGTALLCGIANAGGGSVLVSPVGSNHAKKLKRFRKSFESIPRISQQELGIVCTVEPIMDGVELCLEIRVPAAQAPIRYRNNYYLYTNNTNTIVTRERLDHFFSNSTKEPRQGNYPAEQSSYDKGDFSVLDRNLEHERACNQEQSEEPNSDQRYVFRRDQTAKSNPNLRPTFKDVSIAAANRLDMTSTDEYILNQWTCDRDQNS